MGDRLFDLVLMACVLLGAALCWDAGRAMGCPKPTRDVAAVGSGW